MRRHVQAVAQLVAATVVCAIAMCPMWLLPLIVEWGRR